VRCSSCEPLLDSYLEATLRAREALGVAAHLRACHGCAAFLQELRVIDALLTTARAPRVAVDFTASVVSATHATVPRMPRRTPLAAALLLYVVVAWTIAAIAVVRRYDVTGFVQTVFSSEGRSLAALGAAAHALAPATPVAAAVVTGVLLLDLLLFCAIFFGYRRVRPLIALYLGRGNRS
jgi:anti-sigma factor RsiW